MSLHPYDAHVIAQRIAVAGTLEGDRHSLAQATKPLVVS
jgi:hypothetical protein